MPPTRSTRQNRSSTTTIPATPNTSSRTAKDQSCKDFFRSSPPHTRAKAPRLSRQERNSFTIGTSRRGLVNSASVGEGRRPTYQTLFKHWFDWAPPASSKETRDVVRSSKVPHSLFRETHSRSDVMIGHSSSEYRRNSGTTRSGTKTTIFGTDSTRKSDLLPSSTLASIPNAPVALNRRPPPTGTLTRILDSPSAPLELISPVGSDIFNTPSLVATTYSGGSSVSASPSLLDSAYRRRTQESNQECMSSKGCLTAENPWDAFERQREFVSKAFGFHIDAVALDDLHRQAIRYMDEHLWEQTEEPGMAMDRTREAEVLRLAMWGLDERLEGYPEEGEGGCDIDDSLS